MCFPPKLNCAASHYPLVIDGALARLHRSAGEVQLSPAALEYLYEYGGQHKKAFEQILKLEQQVDFDALSKQLRDRLEAALRFSQKADSAGRQYHPPRIDRKGLKRALAADPWIR